MEKNNKKDYREELKKQIIKILKESFAEIEKRKKEDFFNRIDSLQQIIKTHAENFRKENLDLKLNNFKYKLAIITFNGALLALMVGSREQIMYGFSVFILLFLSFSIGIIQLIIHYLKNEYNFIEGDIFINKCMEIFNFCKEHPENPNIITNTHSFIRSEILKYKKDYNNIPELINDFDKKNSVKKSFTRILLIELLFYIPFIIGFALVIYKVFYFINY